MNIQISVSNVFKRIYQANTRIIVNEGSSRSTKTYSIIQYLIGDALANPGTKTTICRLKATWLMATVFPDFEDILRNQYGLWHDGDWHKSDRVYTLKSSEFHFVGLDEPQKLHGRKQHKAWINEAIEARKKDFEQLAIRTTDQIILDYNPSSEVSWIYDAVIPRKDCTFIKSTYKDNPFLDPAVRAEIERLEPTPENIEQGTADEVSWKIYGLGERATQKGLIFGNAKIVDEFPADCKKFGYGLDFGYTNDPTALIKCGLYQGELYFEELLYERGLTNRINPDHPNQPNIEHELLQLKISQYDEIWADSGDPKSIQDLSLAGFKVLPAKKGPGSVVAGIEVMKRYKVNIVKSSVNLIKERNNYKWKTNKAGKTTNEPVDAFNHGWDAARYWTYMELGLPSVEPDIR